MQDSAAFSEMSAEKKNVRQNIPGEECYGRIIDPIPPMNMTSLTERIACAKRGGPTFLETIRADPGTGDCPRNYVPCSNYTGPTDTVCVREYEKQFECPIIDLFVVQDVARPYFESLGFEVTSMGYP